MDLEIWNPLVTWKLPDFDHRAVILCASYISQKERSEISDSGAATGQLSFTRREPAKSSTARNLERFDFMWLGELPI